MLYTLESKLKCIELYRKGLWAEYIDPETLDITPGKIYPVIGIIHNKGMEENVCKMVFGVPWDWRGPLNVMKSHLSMLQIRIFVRHINQTE